MEPVNGGTLDEGWKTSSPNMKGIAHGRQTQHHLQGRTSEDKESPRCTHKQQCTVCTTYICILVPGMGDNM